MDDQTEALIDQLLERIVDLERLVLQNSPGGGPCSDTLHRIRLRVHSQQEYEEACQTQEL